MALLSMAAAAIASPAAAETYRSSYINNWSGCQCNETGLDYTDDQISQFNSAMNSHSYTKLSTYSNGSAWASDLAEDSASVNGVTCSGSDRYYSDDVDAWAYSGHGGQYADSSGNQHYVIPFCNKGSSSFGGTCSLDVTKYTYMGEQSPVSYASPSAGVNRWMLLATCYSVHTAPHQQWGNSMRYGTEYVLGYRGTSADSENTDEVLGDFVALLP
jgi:Family of unknown function (DUF6345)